MGGATGAPAYRARVESGNRITRRDLTVAHRKPSERRAVSRRGRLSRADTDWSARARRITGTVGRTPPSSPSRTPTTAGTPPAAAAPADARAAGRRRRATRHCIQRRPERHRRARATEAAERPATRPATRPAVGIARAVTGDTPTARAIRRRPAERPEPLVHMAAEPEREQVRIPCIIQPRRGLLQLRKAVLARRCEFLVSKQEFLRGGRSRFVQHRAMRGDQQHRQSGRSPPRAEVS